MRAITRWALMAGLLTSAGCGESKQQLEMKLDLQHIGMAYHNFYSSHDRGPHNADELIAYEDPAARSMPGNAATQTGVRKALRSGNYVVIWDVELLLPAERNSGMILAYHREVPDKGGVVCYQDGLVATLTREEFERAPKSQPKTGPKR